MEASKVRYREGAGEIWGLICGGCSHPEIDLPEGTHPENWTQNCGLKDDKTLAQARKSEKSTYNQQPCRMQRAARS